jgi:hypothetical protein
LTVKEAIVIGEFNVAEPPLSSTPGATMKGSNKRKFYLTTPNRSDGLMNTIMPTITSLGTATSASNDFNTPAYEHYDEETPNQRNVHRVVKIDRLIPKAQ